MKKLFITFCILLGLFCSLTHAQIQDNPDKQLSTAAYDHVENSIAINPVHPNNIIVVTAGQYISANNIDMPYYYSTDGGNSWSGNEDLQSGKTFGGDPNICFDVNGNAYYVALGSDMRTIDVAKSTNEGESWISPFVNANIAGDYVDNPDAKADLSGIYPNNVYVVWTGTNGYDRIRFSSSTDAGNSFSSPIELESTSNTKNVRGSNISIGPNGEVYVFWALDEPETAIRFCKITGGGSTVSPASTAFSISGINNGDQGNASFYNTRVNSWPSSDVDRTNGSRRGWIYVVYTDNSSGDADIYLRRSTDNGATWGTNAILVNQKTGDGKEQWFPSISVDQVSGDLFISYYGMDSTGAVVGRFMAVSTDGGNTFTNIRTSDSWFTPTGTSYNANFMGDYYKTAAYGNKGFACWSDNSSGHYQVFISKVSFPSFTATVDQKLSDGITTVGTVKRWQSSSFNAFPSLPATPTFTIGTNEILQGDQTIYSNQKYHQWNTDPDVTNHHVFSIDGNTNRFVSNFNLINSGVTVQNSLLDDPSYSLSNTNVGFADPWLIDYPDPNYGNTKRNEGMSAPLKSRISPFKPDSTKSFNGDVYQGIFLNQSGPPNWNPPYYSVSFPSSQAATINGVNHNIYFQNWTTSPSGSATFQNATGTSTPVVFTGTNSFTVMANVKATQLSNESATFSNNSQRKFVRTADSTLHMVYSSLGHVWYEISTDNGTTWTLANAGKPLDTNGGKLPAIDNQGNDVVIVWEENYYNAVELKVARFRGGVMAQYYPLIAFVDGNQSYSQNLDPVIAYDYEERATIAWENKGSSVYPIGIVVEHGVLGSLYSTTYTWTTDYASSISSTNSNCFNPTISAAKNPSDQYNMVYNLAWQYNQSSSNSSVNFCKITANTGGVTLSSVSTPSTGSGFQLNYNPSIVSMNDNTARLVWLGYAPWYGYRVAYNYNDASGVWSSSIINMGSNVVQPYINNTDNGYFVIGWVQNNGSLTNNLVKSDNIYHIENFQTTGNNLQINNASSYSTMYAMTFQNQTAPYSFKLSSNVSTFPKSSNLTVNKGRAEVISYSGNDYCFGAGDITVDGQNVDFVSLSSLKTLPEEDTLNYFLRSNDFDITDKSNLTFGLFHGMISAKDTIGVINSFGNNDYINVKAVIVDAGSNKILSQIGSYDIKKGDTFPTDISDYKFNSAGIGTRKVRLELILDNNIQPRYSINDFFSNGSSVSITKSSTKEVSYNENGAVTSYALNQNYPNPFNPTTIINYQIPKEGIVTIKIFDTLGREVKTLVNGYKSQGRYSVSFDASNFSSGVYFYQLKAGNYSSIKKMVLLK